MSKTSIRTAVNPPATGVTAGNGAAPAAPRATPLTRPVGPLRKALSVLASLRLTVVLFALAIVLVFCGTLAQMDDSIYTVLSHYFRCFVAWIPLQVFVRFCQVFFADFGFPRTLEVPGSFPFPGGYVIGGALLANLLAAHAVRFRVGWKRSGILLIHGGLIVMLLGELVTSLFAVEGRMTIPAGESSTYTEDYHKAELAIIDPSDPKDDDVVVVPGSLLRKGGLIRDDALPFDVEGVRYLVNSGEPQEIPEGEKTPADRGLGLRQTIPELAPSRGTSEKVDAPSAYVTFKKKGTDEALGTYLVSVLLGPQTVEVGDKKYHVSLRFKRTYKPYRVDLLEFKHDVFEGTQIAKNYSSRIRLVDPERGEEHQVLIYMNSPLRYRGETFYQSSFLPGDRGTVLQVVRNPGWLMPYFSCAMVSLGMLVHFGIHLVGFLRRRAA